MATKRMLSTAIFVDPKIGALSHRQRLVFISLITLADDHGLFRAEPAIVRAHAFGFEDIAVADIGADLKRLSEVGLIVPYSIHGEEYGRLAAWYKWQRLDRASKPQCPAPPGWRAVHIPGKTTRQDSWILAEEESPGVPRHPPGSPGELSRVELSRGELGRVEGAREQPPLPMGPIALAQTDDSTPERERWVLSEEDSGSFSRDDVREAYAGITKKGTTHSDRELIAMLETETRFSSRAVITLMETIAVRAGSASIYSFNYFRSSIADVEKRCFDAAHSAKVAGRGDSPEKRRRRIYEAVRKEVIEWMNRRRAGERTG